jgi:hypothetical protein
MNFILARREYITKFSDDKSKKDNMTRSLTTPSAYGKLQAAWSRGVVAKHAALSRPRSRVRIPSGPLLC